MRKKVLTGVIVSVLLLNSCLATQVFADEGESTVLEINPLDASVRWANVITVSPSLSFSNGQACCHATIQGKSNVTMVDSTYTLQRKNASGSFSTVKTWTLSTSGRNQSFSGSHAVSNGYTYRFKVSTKVKTSSGTTETVTKHIDKTY